MDTPLRKNRSFSAIRSGLVAFDLVAVVASCALAAALASRFAWEIRIPFVGLGARVVTPSVGIVWMASLVLGGAHDARLIFAGSDYSSRVFRATFTAFGVIGLLTTTTAPRSPRHAHSSPGASRDLVFVWKWPVKVWRQFRKGDVMVLR